MKGAATSGTRRRGVAKRGAVCYEPMYYTVQRLCCAKCGWRSDFEQVFRDCGMGDGDMIDGPEWYGGCPRCGEERVGGKVQMFWVYGNEGVLFAWGEEEA